MQHINIGELKTKIYTFFEKHNKFCKINIILTIKKYIIIGIIDVPPF